MVSAASSSFDSKLYLSLAILIVYIGSVCVYRLFYHPLARIPGPPLAAVTKLYQSYYNRYFYLQIEELHKRYGPVVRITPDELHLSDPENYDKINHVGTKFSKSPNFYNALCVPDSTFGTPSNDLHRIRRGALNPMFSRQKVLELECIVQDKAAKVCQRMQQGIDAGQPVDLHHAFRAVSVDVISEFAFGECYDFLDKSDIGETFFQMTRGIGPALWAFQQLPLIQRLALKTPPWMAPYVSKPLGYVTGLQMESARQIEGVRSRMRNGKDVGRETIFTTLLSPQNKPDGYRVPTTWQLKDEAYSVLAAAADTTGNAMTVAAFHVLRNEEVYAKLSAELKTKFSTQRAVLSLLELEKLPYLSAVIKEGLRLSFGVIGRLPRVVPSRGANFNDFFVPEGTIVSMSSWMMHRDPSVFENPMLFNPERWLAIDSKEYRQREHNLVPFGRGTRQCVGMNLAYSELYIVLGTFFRRFSEGLRPLSSRTEQVISQYEDFFSSYHPYARRRDWLKAHKEK